MRSRASAGLVFRFLLILLSAAVLHSPVLAADAVEGTPRRIVGIVVDGNGAPGQDNLLIRRREETLVRIEQEVRALTRPELDVVFSEDKRRSGDWELGRIRAAIDELLADPEIDVVLAAGALASAELIRLGELPKPAIALYVVDIESQEAPFADNASGRRNLNYLVSPGSVTEDLRSFREIVPFSRVHLLLDSLAPAAIPGLAGYAARVRDALGIDIAFVPVERTAAAALDALPPDAEAVYIAPMLRLSTDGFEELLRGLTARRLPSFSLIGEDEVEAGVLATARSRTDLTRFARRVALNLQRILRGEDAGSLPVILDQPTKLIVNMATARAIGLPLRWRVLMEAERIADEPAVPPPALTLSGAVAQAIEANLTLRASQREVAAGVESVAQARARLRPGLELTAGGVRIDEDRAEASLGSQAEVSTWGALSLEQLVYSDAALADVEISRALQDALERDLDALRLGVALEAAAAFLGVLRAETLLRVEQDNLRLTQRNLDLARRRLRIGHSGPADVYRWESQLATDLSNVIRAHSSVRSARVALNRVRHSPLEEPFAPDPPTLEDPELLTGGRLQRFLDTRQGFDRFREFLVLEGLAAAPELQALDAATAARERSRLAARRSFWSPLVGLSGQYEREVSRSGAGSGGAPSGFPTSDRNDWSLALQATLPLYAGGERASRLRQATEELSQLRLERRALAEAIELRIRAAVFSTGGSFPAIDLSRQAAEAARKNLELVTDAYSSGAVSIIDLLDAQNAALVAEQGAANAVYDFLLDLMEVQRAASSFGFFLTESGREAWYRRLEGFFDAGPAEAAPTEVP